ncbi:conjugal transfer protein [Streptomyces sp. NPDC017949]|uniref:conjugal transfer protein n=1 Tax=Streptomyces sp. NPDC017949 TaxID=3365020 RepID=UPI00378F7A17
MGETDSMTDHNSSAGGVDGGQTSGQQAQFGPAGHADAQQAPSERPQQPAPGPYGEPGAAAVPSQPFSDAARAQVAAAWVRTARPANVPPGEASVPVLPPRAQQSAGDAKKDKREKAKAAQEAKRAERKAAYENKKAEREARKQGRGGKGSAPVSGVAAPVAAAQTPGGAVSGAKANVPLTAAAAVQPAAVAPSAPSGRADAAFDVPRPGGRLPAQGRRTHVAVRVTLLVTTCAFALGSCGVAGLVIGKSSVAVQSGSLDEKDLQKYRLTDFPAQAAATFAEEYVTLCMTYSPQTYDKRREAMTRYTSAGVDRDCGVTGQGSQEVRGAQWDGTLEELPEYGPNGRYLGIQVQLSTGRTTTVSVPVYVKDLAAGSGLRIAGDVGEMPLPVRGIVPPVKKEDEVVDQALSDQLRAQVLPGYFKAWGASDTTGLARFTSTDATQSATAGLAGALSTPEVQAVVALAPVGSKPGTAIAYGPGQTVVARVTVVWGSGAGAAKATPAPTSAPAVKRSYRVTLVNTAQGWFIKDVRGGTLDPTGGNADAGATPSATPAPEESRPAPSQSGGPAPSQSGAAPSQSGAAPAQSTPPPGGASGAAKTP